MYIVLALLQKLGSRILFQFLFTSCYIEICAPIVNRNEVHEVRFKSFGKKRWTNSTSLLQ
jgi:hypothetical protein